MENKSWAEHCDVVGKIRKEVDLWLRHALKIPQTIIDFRLMWSDAADDLLLLIRSSFTTNQLCGELFLLVMNIFFNRSSYPMLIREKSCVVCSQFYKQLNNISSNTSFRRRERCLKSNKSLSLKKIFFNLSVPRWEIVFVVESRDFDDDLWILWLWSVSRFMRAW